jgi:hypothetical protein
MAATNGTGIDTTGEGFDSTRGGVDSTGEEEGRTGGVPEELMAAQGRKERAGRQRSCRRRRRKQEEGQLKLHSRQRFRDIEGTLGSTPKPSYLRFRGRDFLCPSKYYQGRTIIRALFYAFFRFATFSRRLF